MLGILDERVADVNLIDHGTSQCLLITPSRLAFMTLKWTFNAPL